MRLIMKLWGKSHSIGYPTLTALAAAITCGGFYLPSLPPRSKIDVREPATWSLVEAARFAAPFCTFNSTTTRYLLCNNFVISGRT